MYIKYFNNSYHLGLIAEYYAKYWLIAHGLKILAHRYSSPYGEIDLILQDQATLVALEVRFRRHPRSKTAAESITPLKYTRIIQTLEYYRQYHPTPHLPNERIDCIAIDHWGIQWLKNIEL